MNNNQLVAMLIGMGFFAHRNMDKANLEKAVRWLKTAETHDNNGRPEKAAYWRKRVGILLDK